MEDLVSYLVQYTGVVYLCGGMCCSVGQLITDALSLVSGVARCVCVCVCPRRVTSPLAAALVLGPARYLTTI